ncbi:MAG: acylphosphatase [Halarcobacter sp.]
MKSYRFLVSGKVQGVYYRKNVAKNANTQKFYGYVKNLPDRTVEAVVTCEEHRLNDFIQILKKGSPSSIVKDIKQFDNIEKIYHDKFKIM